MFFDNLAIRRVRVTPQAHVFINYLLRPEVAQKRQPGGLRQRKSGGREFIDKAVLDDKSVYPTLSMSRLYTVSARDQKSQRFVNRLWTKIKTGR